MRNLVWVLCLLAVCGSSSGALVVYSGVGVGGRLDCAGEGAAQKIPYFAIYDTVSGELVTLSYWRGDAGPACCVRDLSDADIWDCPEVILISRTEVGPTSTEVLAIAGVKKRVRLIRGEDPLDIFKTAEGAWIWKDDAGQALQLLAHKMRLNKGYSRRYNGTNPATGQRWVFADVVEALEQMLAARGYQPGGCD